MFCSAFLKLQFGIAIFWRKNVGAKAARKMLVKLITGYSKSSEDSYNNESSALLNRIENGGESVVGTNGNGNVHGKTNNNNNSNGSGVLRPLRPIPNSGSYGRLHTGNGTAMLGMGGNRVDEFEVYNKLSFNGSSNNRPPSVANGKASNGRRKKEEEGEYK